ncbi:MAG: GTPase ObgE [Candidatus Hydrogenedentes bacterium]|nr:GTPase ObgE [Candidatus Hydrogenedentota bacterium]
MFVDRVRIRVTGGAGGNGSCSFRREKYVPRGGPDGGDGGHGGDVFFVADPDATTLVKLRYHAHWKAESGGHGRGSNKHGKKGTDTLIPVPCGTLVRDLETQKIQCDLSEPGQRFCAVHGGRGGKGNARFATPTRRVPRFAEQGEPGEEADYILELKLIAEVGLVGLPNAGKSTFLSRVTAAHPKIADYPFTTVTPHLGVAELDGFRTLTLADIPGIIEGAAQGKGLGHDFLRHIERTKVLLCIIDTGDQDPEATLKMLENELEEHSAIFSERPKILALNKIDLPDNRNRAKDFCRNKTNAFPISAVTGEGIGRLLEHLWTVVEQLGREKEKEETTEPEEVEYTYEVPYTIERENDGFRVEGKPVLRAVSMTDFENDEAIAHLQHMLRRMGLFKALKRLGAQTGEPIYIGEVKLEYRPE